MKKLFTIVFIGIGFLFSTHANAQFGWGVKGGVNFSSIKNFGDQLAGFGSTSNYTAWHAGIFLQMKVPILTVQADILYSIQGQDFEILNEPFNLEQTYINIPVVAKFSLLPVINLQAGLQYGILVGAAINDVEEFDFGAGPQKVEDLFKSGDWALVFGIGFDISKLMIDARYNLGVSDISDVSLGSVDPLNSGVIQLSAGIKF